MKVIEVLIITGGTTGKVKANNTAIKNIKRTAQDRNPAAYKSVILLRRAALTAARPSSRDAFPHEHEEPHCPSIGWWLHIGAHPG